MADVSTHREPMHRFRWLALGDIPSPFDLRVLGWDLDAAREPSSECVCVLDARSFEDADWDRVLTFPDDVRRALLVIGGTAHQRTRLLQAGVGEALIDTIDSAEFAVRACRLADITCWLPRHRQIGDLKLDLLAREAYCGAKALNLNPREFALVWRLADAPGEVVSKQDLIQDVWRMGFVPETNSIAVHMSRLRRKLGFAGMDGIIATSASGGYCLLLPQDMPSASKLTHMPMQRRPLETGGVMRVAC